MCTRAPVPGKRVAGRSPRCPFWGHLPEHVREVGAPEDSFDPQVVAHVALRLGTHRLTQCELEPAFRVRPRIPGQRRHQAHGIAARAGRPAGHLHLRLQARRDHRAGTEGRRAKAISNVAWPITVCSQGPGTLRKSTRPKASQPASVYVDRQGSRAVVRRVGLPRHRVHARPVVIRPRG